MQRVKPLVDAGPKLGTDRRDAGGEIRRWFALDFGLQQ